MQYKYNSELQISKLIPDYELIIDASIYFKYLNCYVLDFQHLEEY